MILSPSILACDFARLGEQVRQVEAAGCEWLHIDVMDGLFVPSISFGFPVIKSIRKVSRLLFDVHLMICSPERYIGEFAKAGADLITVHYEAFESAEKLVEVLERIRALGCMCGVSVKPTTPVEELAPCIGIVDLVLVMTVEPGWGGQSLMEETLEKIVELKRIREERGLAYKIEVDGGINAANITCVCKMGVDVAVAGTAVFGGEDIKANIEKLMMLSGGI